MANEASKKIFDLGDRTFKFSQNIIALCGKIQKNQINNPLISQLVRAGTSIGANYAEADVANSKKDFVNKIAISRKEINETKYWLRLLSDLSPENSNTIEKLSKEVQELNLIFAAIIRKSKENSG